MDAKETTSRSAVPAGPSGRQKAAPHNPVISGMSPDPSICKAGDVYYLTSSTFFHFPGLPIYRSPDLVNWTLIGNAFDACELDLSKLSSMHGLYAPTIRWHRGIFYIVCTLVGGRGHFLITSSDPEGGWSKPIWLGAEGIDPSLFFDDDGSVYFTYTAGGHICQALLDLQTHQLRDSRAMTQGSGGSYPEGPHLYKRNGVYYLVISEGGTEYCHMVTVARSQSPWGPWEWAPSNPVLSHRSKRSELQSVGHADLLFEGDQCRWAVCLGVRPRGYPPRHHLGRETMLVPVRWGSDGWPEFGVNGMVPVSLKGQGLAPVITSRSERDDFDGGSLSPEWLGIRESPLRHASLNERKGFLRLKAAGPLLTDRVPSWVGRRQRHMSCEFSAALDVNSLSGEAGIAVYMNRHHHLKLSAKCVGARVEIRAIARIGSVESVVGKASLERLDEIVLYAVCRTSDYEVGVRAGTHAVAVGRLESKYLSTEVAGGFCGVFLGMFLETSEAGGSADFDWADYHDHS